MKILVSIVVPTYNRGRSLCDTLNCLINQDYRFYEIIVVDQSDRIFLSKQAFFKQHKNRFKLIKLKQANLPRARNYGVKAARGEVIIFCDDDILCGPKFVANHVVNYQDKTIGAVAGRVVEKNKAVLSVKTVGRITSWGTVGGGFSSEKKQQVGNLFGCNFSVKKELIFAVGGFDENFTGNALREESDFALRLVKAGSKIIFDPKSEVTHLHTLVKSGGCRKTGNRLRWYRDFFQNESYFFLKHFSLVFLPLFYLIRWQYFFRSMFGFGREVSLKSLSTPWLGIYLGFKSFLKKNDNRD